MIYAWSKFVNAPFGQARFDRGKAGEGSEPWFTIAARPWNTLGALLLRTLTAKPPVTQRAAQRRMTPRVAL